MKKHFQITAQKRLNSFLLLLFITLLGSGTSLAESLKIESVSPQPGEVFKSTEYPEAIEVKLNATELTWTGSYFNYTTVSNVSYKNLIAMSKVPSGSSQSSPVVFENGTLKINFRSYLEDARKEAMDNSDFNVCITGLKSGDLFLSESDVPNGIEINPETGDLNIHFKIDYVTSTPFVYPDVSDVVFICPEGNITYRYSDKDYMNFRITVGTPGGLRIQNSLIKDNRLFYDKELTQLVPCSPTTTAKSNLRYENLEVGHTYYYYGEQNSTTGLVKLYLDDGFTLGRPLLPENGSIDVESGDEYELIPSVDGKLTINFNGKEASQWLYVYEDNSWVLVPYLKDSSSQELSYKVKAECKYKLAVPYVNKEMTKATLTMSFREWLSLEVNELSPSPNSVYPFNSNSNLTLEFPSRYKTISLSEIKVEYESLEGHVTILGEDINVSLIRRGSTPLVYVINFTNLQNIFKGTVSKYPAILGDKFTVTLAGFEANYGTEVDELTGAYEAEGNTMVLNYIFDAYDGMIKTVGEPNWPKFFTVAGPNPAEPIVIEYASDIQLGDVPSISIWGMYSQDPSGRDLPEDIDVPSYDLVKFSSVSGNKLIIDLRDANYEYESLDGMMSISITNLISGKTPVAPVLATIPFVDVKKLTYEIEGISVLTTQVIPGSVAYVTFPENSEFKVVGISFNGEEQEVSEKYITPVIEENSVLDITYEYAGDIDFDFTTGVSSPEECPYVVSHEGENLNIHGVKAGDNIKVYSLGGLKMADLGTVPSENSMVTFRLPTGCVYIVTINDKALKIKH